MKVGAGLSSLLALVPAPAWAAFVDHTDAFRPVFSDGSPLMDGPGVGFFDADGDGDPDVVVSHGASGVRLYENGGPPDYAFEDVTEASGLGAVSFGYAYGVAASDLDRDGDADLVVGDRTRGVRFFENQGGTFVDVSVLAGALEPLTTTSLALADLDGDGWTDVWAAGGRYFFDSHVISCAPGVLLHNRGDFVFDEVSEAWGVVDGGCTLGLLASDFDRDGDVDLFAADDYGSVVGPNRLLRNDGLRPDGSLRFTDVSEASGFGRRMFGMGLATADVDGDEWPDYYVTNIGRAALWLGSADGVFEDATARYGVEAELAHDGLRVTWGAAFLDVEMDGVLDLHVANGAIPTGAESRSDLYARSLLFPALDGARRTADVAPDVGLDAEGSFKGTAIADFDADGDDDVLTAALGGPVHLFRNDGDAGPVVAVTLHGTVSSPEALGARLVLRCGDVVRAHEVFSTGSYASTHSTQVRIPLAGCAGVATLEIDWPSGLVETVDVPAEGAVLEPVEPEWIEVSPAWLPADGTSAATIRLSPLGEDGSPLGAGHEVSATASGGVLSPVADEGDGTYETTLVAPLAAGDAALSFEIDGVPAGAHPRVRFFEGDRTLVRAARATAAPGAEIAVDVIPRDAAGVRDGAGLGVVLDVTGGALSATEDLGDGRYEVVVVADGGSPIDLSARVEGAPRGPSLALSPIEAVDPARTLLRITPGAMSAADVAVTDVEIFVSPRDGRGAPVPDATAHRYELVGAGGPLAPRGAGFGPSFSAGWHAHLPAADVVRDAPISVLVDGVPLARTVDLPAVEDVDDVLALADLGRSMMSVSPEVVRADGQDYASVVAYLADVDGDPLPWPEACTFASDALTLVTDGTTGAGTQYKSRMRATGPVGRGTVSVRCADADVGLSVVVDLVSPAVHDLASLDVETCPDPPYLFADGESAGRIAVRPRDEHGSLVGSGVPLRLWVADVEVPLDYGEPGTYFAAIAPTPVPGETWIETELVGTGRRSRTFVERTAPEADPDLERNGCVLLDPAPPAGEDAGPDAGPEPEDASPPPMDAEAGPPPEEAVRLAPRGAGCTCGSTGATPAHGIGWAIAVLGLVRRRKIV